MTLLIAGAGVFFLFGIYKVISINNQEAIDVAEINKRYEEGGDLYRG